MTVTFTSDASIQSIGFEASFEIIAANAICLANSDCNSLNTTNTCVSGVCVCGSLYYGQVCELKKTNFAAYTPRERHSVAYDSTNDIAYISFGRNWDAGSTNKLIGDVLYYNFALDKWGSTVLVNFPKRYDHVSWVYAGSLYIMGGRNEYKAFNDMWVLIYRKFFI